MEELIKQRIEVYKKDLDNIGERIVRGLSREEFDELNNRYNRYTSIIEELEFILRKIKED